MATPKALPSINMRSLHYICPGRDRMLAQQTTEKVVEFSKNYIARHAMLLLKKIDTLTFFR